MKINKETAMRLWTKHFGKSTEVYDYTGRQIIKGAYNDRKSQYGWNVDHIYPQTKGGKTADHNLICCHILTNDEKAEKFPCFIANGKKFEIQKFQNHYEIVPLDGKNYNDEINFYDFSQGLSFFNKQDNVQKQKIFIGTILINLWNIKSSAIIDFIEKMFGEENVAFNFDAKNYNERITKILIKNYSLPYKENIQSLLEKCLLLNTYLSEYFFRNQIIGNYQIFYRVDFFEKKEEMYQKNQGILEENFSKPVGLIRSQPRPLPQQLNYLFINDLVKINTFANNEAKECQPHYHSLIGFQQNIDWFEFNKVYTKLSKDLTKI